MKASKKQSVEFHELRRARDDAKKRYEDWITNHPGDKDFPGAVARQLFNRMEKAKEKFFAFSNRLSMRG